MPKIEWKKESLKAIYVILFFSLFSLFLYPRPLEIILLVAIGLGIIILISFAYKRMGALYLQKQTIKAKVLKGCFYVLSACFVIYFILLLNTAWFDNKLLFNILQTDRGRRNIVIAIITAAAVLIYSFIFYLFRGNWPKADSGDKSSLSELDITILVGLSVTLFVVIVGWSIYRLFLT